MHVVTKSQKALSLELRATMALARLAAARGESAAARDHLASVYSRFTEGFDTADLVAARALLDALGKPAAELSGHPVESMAAHSR